MRLKEWWWYFTTTTKNWFNDLPTVVRIKKRAHNRRSKRLLRQRADSEHEHRKAKAEQEAIPTRTRLL